MVAGAYGAPPIGLAPCQGSADRCDLDFQIDEHDAAACIESLRIDERETRPCDEDGPADSNGSGESTR